MCVWLYGVAVIVMMRGDHASAPSDRASNLGESQRSRSVQLSKPIQSNRAAAAAAAANDHTTVNGGRWLACDRIVFTHTLARRDTKKRTRSTQRCVVYVPVA